MTVMYLHSWSAVRHGNSTFYILPYYMHSRDVTTFFRIQAYKSVTAVFAFVPNTSHSSLSVFIIVIIIYIVTVVEIYNASFGFV